MLKLKRSNSFDPSLLNTREKPSKILQTISENGAIQYDLNSSETSEIFLSETSRHINWFCRKEFFLLNGIWILLGVSYSIAVITVATTITGS